MLATPPVALVIAAFNEALVMAEKIRNTLALDYPAKRLTIVVVCEGLDRRDRPNRAASAAAAA